MSDGSSGLEDPPPPPQPEIQHASARRSSIQRCFLTLIRLQPNTPLSENTLLPSEISGFMEECDEVLAILPLRETVLHSDYGETITSTRPIDSMQAA